MNPEPEDFVIHACKRTALQVMAFTGAVLTAAILFLAVLRNPDTPVLLTGFAMVLAPLMAVVMFQAIRSLLRRSPLLIVSRKGITHCEMSMDSLIPWEHVARVALSAQHYNRLVAIVVKDFDAYIAARERSLGRKVKFRLEPTMGGDKLVLIDLAFSPISAKELADRLRGYHEALVGPLAASGLTFDPLLGAPTTPDRGNPENPRAEGAKAGHQPE